MNNELKCANSFLNCINIFLYLSDARTFENKYEQTIYLHPLH